MCGPFVIKSTYLQNLTILFGPSFLPISPMNHNHPSPTFPTTSYLQFFLCESQISPIFIPSLLRLLCRRLTELALVLQRNMEFESDATRLHLLRSIFGLKYLLFKYIITNCQNLYSHWCFYRAHSCITSSGPLIFPSPFQLLMLGRIITQC